MSMINTDIPGGEPSAAVAAAIAKERTADHVYSTGRDMPQ